MYAALILDDLGIPYEILESRDRVGGRLYTHKFDNEIGAPYNYFDVGAMRFPEISSMARVFHLFDLPSLDVDSSVVDFARFSRLSSRTRIASDLKEKGTTSFSSSTLMDLRR